MKAATSSSSSSERVAKDGSKIKYDELMSEPMMDEVNSQHEAPLTRSVASSSSFESSIPFILQKKDFTQQYAPLYSIRLASMRPLLKQQATALWPDVKMKSKVLDLDQSEEAVVLVGTMYKEMKLKPSILNQYSRERGVEVVPHQSYVLPTDYLILEDESGRVRLNLTGSEYKHEELITGLVVAVKGKEVEGELQVEEMCFAHYPTCQIQQMKRKPLTGSKYIALASGLDIGNPALNPLYLQLFIDFIVGSLGSFKDQIKVADIIRLIVVGNSVHPPSASAEAVSQDWKSSRVQRDAAQTKMIASTKESDLVFSQLASSIPIDIMPGKTDPTNFLLPQQPFNPCLFPSTASYSTVHFATNPYSCDIEGVSLLGTSGQNVDDMFQFMHMENRLDIMSNCIKWGHIAPSTPDTLSAYPFEDRDPFILKQIPHVYFVGNQPSFESTALTLDDKEVKLISVPSFNSTSTILLLDVKTLECHPVTFSLSLD